MLNNDLTIQSDTDSAKTTSFFHAVLDLFKEGLLILESNGAILHANEESCRLFHVEIGSLAGNNISAFLTEKSTLLTLIANNKAIDYLEQYFIINNINEALLVGIRPIRNIENNDLEAVIIMLNRSNNVQSDITTPDTINIMGLGKNDISAKYNFSEIIGESEAIQKTKKMAGKFAQSSENVLIIGESGIGKELFAQSIHHQYQPEGPFIAINCAAMPRNLIVSELFGYESGAFSGAEKIGKPGKIELANGGILFLDEIGDMPLELQSVLCRVLQDKLVMRLGGMVYHQVDFRLIAASIKDLKILVKEKKFREDLYYLLSVFTLDIPPLRERDRDALILAEHFITKYTRHMGWPRPNLSSRAKLKIMEYCWPGNVRQLENAMIYAVNMAEEQVIDAYDLPQDIFIAQEKELDNSLKETKIRDGELSFKALSVKESVKESEKVAIFRALKATGYNIDKASATLGISKTTLYRKVKEQGINLKDKR